MIIFGGRIFVSLILLSQSISLALENAAFFFAITMKNECWVRFLHYFCKKIPERLKHDQMLEFATQIIKVPCLKSQF